jgi:uncharacterized protein with PIN domain
MGAVFGKDKPLKEVLRENKRMINRAVRELDREKTALEREEKRLTLEIKQQAKQQQMQAVKIMAKVRLPKIIFLAFTRCKHCVDNFLFCINEIDVCRTWFALDNILPNSLKCEVIYRDAH